MKWVILEISTKVVLGVTMHVFKVNRMFKQAFFLFSNSFIVPTLWFWKEYLVRGGTFRSYATWFT